MVDAPKKLKAGNSELSSFLSAFSLFGVIKRGNEYYDVLSEYEKLYYSIDVLCLLGGYSIESLLNIYENDSKEIIKEATIFTSQAILQELKGIVLSKLVNYDTEMSMLGAILLDILDWPERVNPAYSKYLVVMGRAKLSTEGHVKTGHFERRFLSYIPLSGGILWQTYSKWLCYRQLSVYWSRAGRIGGSPGNWGYTVRQWPAMTVSGI